MTTQNISELNTKSANVLTQYTRVDASGSNLGYLLTATREEALKVLKSLALVWDVSGSSYTVQASKPTEFKHNTFNIIGGVTCGFIPQETVERLELF